MHDYCIDANVFIQSKNGPYSFDFFPSFWDWLSKKIDQKVIFVPKMVFIELTKGNDELAAWVREQKRAGFSIEPNEADQEVYRDIANYVAQKYPVQIVEEYLRSGDPWIVAQAKTRDAVVVTQEKLVPDSSQKIKIPNISRQFGVKYIDIYELIRRLNGKIMGMQ